MIYHCCDQLRRNAVDAHATLNGIDYVEVVDNDAPAFKLRQLTLLVRLLKPVPASLNKTQVRIEGGERVRDIGIAWVAPASTPPVSTSAAEQALYAALPEPDHVLLVRVDAYGDHSTYTLRLVRSALDLTPPQGFDPRLSEVAFSFKAECPSDFDCKRTLVCPDEPAPAPVIDYLAKDYASFRRLILDRITQLVPGWRERSAADLGVTLAELVAYAGDQLSYRQDAVATEAYLETARLRTSLRRHALLVDYHLHDGCNARVWLHLTADAANVALSRSATRFYTRLPGTPPRLTPAKPEDDAALRARPVIFEPLHDAVLHAAHNELYFYAWGDRRCCLAKGATRATLSGHLEDLSVGDVLLFEEVLGPATGESGDADPAHRHVVRLTGVQFHSPDDPDQPLLDPLTGDAITEIAWAAEDGLPFPLCITSVTDSDHDAIYLDNVSVARGNMVLADHGHTLRDAEPLGAVPPARLAYASDRDARRCEGGAPMAIPPRFNPSLAQGPLTFAGTVLKTANAVGVSTSQRLAFDPSAPAASAMVWRMEDTLPEILLESTLGILTEPWQPKRNLLNSDADAREFVVEVEHDGSARLRFGNDIQGRRPEAAMSFAARYRVGNGRAGNVGAGAIAHVVNIDPGILAVRNPLPARGGVDLEDAATVRRRAPQAFRRQERAVTPEDYAEVTERHAGVQRAAATLRWTGSWHTVFVTVDREGGLPVDAGFESRIARHVDRYRMAGHDTEFNDPVYVSLEIDLLVCVLPNYFRADVSASLYEVLSNRVLADGRRGLFHPDNLSFGQTVYLSQIYAAVRQVAGVASVNATRFQRQGMESAQYLNDGFMRLARLEVPRLDNDANFQEHGVLRINLFGGK
jgi:hypothetical protein